MAGPLSSVSGATDDADLLYSVRDNWGAGFVADLTVQAGDISMTGWTLAFDADFEITNLWNAVILSHVGTHYVIGNASWNGTVAAGGTTTFGFQATTGPSGAVPDNLTLNGVPVDGGGTPEPVVPELSIAGTSFAEGSAGAPGHGSFTVTLSEPADGPVTVSWSTADGTATAGSDYQAATGTLTFAAGETTKTIRIDAIGDAVVEGNETFTVTLSGPSGATLATASATGTIQNDDVAPSPVLPKLSINDVTVIEGTAGTGTGGTGSAVPGWLSTDGNQIVDAAGNSVQIAGVNWFGFESSNMAPHGLWTRGYKDMMDQMADLGFNTIRLPFSSDMLHATGTASGVDYSKNPDLAGLTPLEIMDKIVAYAEDIGLKIILDHHRSDSGAGTSGNGLWYDSSHSEDQWIADWQMLAERYADTSAVIGADLHNEPYNGTWGDGGVTDWARAATEAGNAIGEVNDNWLIFVEGIGSYQGSSYWWGGNLMGVRDHPIELDVDNKLVYSAHDYPNSVYPQTWFQGSDFADDLPAKFREMWGYIYEENIAPVYIGEFGTKLVDPKDAPWLEAITSYLGGDFDNDGVSDLAPGDTGPSWTYWSWNPNSGDTGGILNDDWTTVNSTKLAYLEPILFDFSTDVPTDDGGSDGGEADVNYAVFTISLSEASTEAVSVAFHTETGTAGSTDFEARSGTVSFAAGETTKTVAIAITPDSIGEAEENFRVVLDTPTGATIARGTGIATIHDDDGGLPGGGDTGGEDPVSDSLTASFTRVDGWTTGFNGSVTISNATAQTVHGWEIEIEMPYEISNIWNAEIVSHSGDSYVIRNASWNGDVVANGSVNFGFIGSGPGTASEIDLVL
ncbi:cellulase family glycosylhydrolase [Segnochrobactraceae bacterium EtOH-i3]